MKKVFIQISVFLFVALLSSCENYESEIDSNSIVDSKLEQIVINGIEYEFRFYENELGEINLSKIDDEILTSFINQNESMSYYYDSKDVLHLFKNSNEMKEFMEEDTNNNFDELVNKSNISSKILPTDEWAESSLKIYDDKNFQTLLFVSNLGNSSSGFGGTSTNIPNLGSVYVNGNFQDFNDKTSSIKLSMTVPVPNINNIDISYAILFREVNYGGYSLGISTTKYNEFEIADLHQTKMYRKWLKTRYWGNRASSLKHYY